MKIVLSKANTKTESKFSCTFQDKTSGLSSAVIEFIKLLISKKGMYQLVHPYRWRSVVNTGKHIEYSFLDQISF